MKNNLVKQYFTKFVGGHFEPNVKLAYMYPSDRFSIFGLDSVQKTREVEFTGASLELVNSTSSITRGMQEISSRLRSPFSEISHQFDKDIDGSVSLLSSLKSYVQSLPTSEGLLSQKYERAIPLLAKLYHFHVKINSMLATRKSNQEHKHRIHFSLGQIVKHKQFGFRGVIIAWDPKPRMDVTNWDGLTDIECPQEKPFFHVLPDVNDCISTFGGSRHFRYVCQDNLELGPIEKTQLDLEMHLDSEEWKWMSEEGRYIPPSELKVSS